MPKRARFVTPYPGEGASNMISGLKPSRLLTILSITLAVTAEILASGRVASAQVGFDVLHEFAGESAIGNSANALVHASDGNFYGTSGDRGVYNAGTIFRLRPDGTVVPLYTFRGPDGDHPSALIQATDGNLYGTTISGGVNGTGTIFRMTLAGIVTTLYAFPTYRGSPSAPLLQATDGNFYGTTVWGGDFGWGSIFRMTPAGIVTILRSFRSEGNEGGRPIAALTQGADGNLYGSTENCIFRMTLDGAFTLLHASSTCCLAALVQAPDGNFYGTEWYNDRSSHGSVFRMTPLGAVTVVHAFTGGADGDGPVAALALAADGSLFGTTPAGGTLGRGVVFRITTAGAFAVVHSFTGWLDGANPRTSLIQAGDGNLYGTTQAEGAFAQGTIFRMRLDGAVTTLHAFKAGPDGAHPGAALLQAADGSFYGTTQYGGTYDHGTIFRLTPGGAFNVVYTFAGGFDGGHPRASLIEGSDGNLYGTTYDNGAYNFGIAFQMSKSGHFTILHAFNGDDGAYPSAALLQGRDGNFYGTTAAGTSLGHGAVFGMSPEGTVTVLHAFAGDADGAEPVAPLVQTPDGTLYGTTSSDGREHYYYEDCPSSWWVHGTIFKISRGVTTTLRVFDGSVPGALPGFLMQAADGNLYGTMADGFAFCSYSPPAIFRITPAGDTTTLHTFGSDERLDPGLIQATDGNFYGTNTYYDSGTRTYRDRVFQMTPNGAINVVSDGPGLGRGGKLIQAKDGNLYGASSFGGTYGPSWDSLGVVFRINLSAVPSPPVALRVAAAGGARVRLAWATVPNATSYTVKRALVSGQETVLAAGIATTNFTDSSTTVGPRYYYVVSAINRFGESVASYEVSIITRAIEGDFDGDGKTDVTLFRPSTGIWYTRYSSTGTGAFSQWGLSEDVPVPGDYDGDGKADVAVFRPSTGIWYILQSSTGRGAFYQWGVSGDVPAPGDYDGDGTTDVAVFRPSTGIWYVLQSSTGTGAFYQWGLSGDVPVAGDYDGDGKTDVAVFRPSTGIWYVLQSSTGTGAFYRWGLSTDVPVPGDYDGDGKTDVAVFRPSTGIWYVWQSSTGMGAFYQWGLSGDIPVPGDYDGDGQTDVAVFRPSTGIWYVLQSSTGTGAFYQWGLNGDLPILKR
jgi:uncharacterized repeat protein (TIGR03803 family)